MLPPPGTNRILTDSVIVALSETDLPKLCAKLSDIDGVSAKGSVVLVLILGESERLKESAIDLDKEKAKASERLGVSETPFFEKANISESVTPKTLFLFIPDSVAKSSLALAMSSKEAASENTLWNVATLEKDSVTEVVSDCEVVLLTLQLR